MKQELASVKDSVTDRLAALEKALAKNVQQASYDVEETPALTPALSPRRGSAEQASFCPEATR